MGDALNGFFFVMRGALLFLFLSAATSGSTNLPTYVGVWTTPTNALPAKQLPDVPISGNGQLGLLLDTRAAPFPPSPPPPGAASFSIWFSSNDMWSCRAPPPGSAVAGNCGKVALGGVTLTLPPGLAFANFTQALASGELGSAWATAGGGLLTTRTRVHPSAAVATTALAWRPGAGDAPALALNATTWVREATPAHAAPAPAAVFCAAADGAPVPCGSPAAAAFGASRVASSGAAAYEPLARWAALATALVGGGGGGGGAASAQPGAALTPHGAAWGATFAFSLAGGGAGATLVTAEAEAASYAAGADPGPAAAAAALAAAAAPAAVAAASDAFWAAFYGKSSVALPPPYLQELYDGAAYVLGCTAAARAGAAPPGLYGVWATADDCAWNGDYTLDYNQEATFFGAFATNHAEQFAGYAAPILAWRAAGAAQAQREAAAANVSCPPTALVYACHLAPWGAQSDDTSVYMKWNLPYAVLPMISQWEFTHDAAAAAALLPLLAGAVDWLGCYLARDGAGLLHDTNPHNPDAEHEGQLVPDPQIGLAFAARVAAAALDVAAGLGVAPPSAAADVFENLAPFNTAPAPAPPNGTNFTRLPDFRFRGDFRMGAAPSPGACADACAADARCSCFTFCPGPATAGCPEGPSCWFFAAGAAGNGGPNATNFTSGCRVPGPPAPPADNGALWVAYAGASPRDSDTFSLYPAFPAEAFSLRRLPDGARLTAQASSAAYGLAPVGQAGRPLDVFAAAAVGLAGAGGVRAPLAPPPEALAAGLRGFCRAAMGRNGLNYASGGGVENAGLSRGLADLLLFSSPLRPVDPAAGGGGGGGGGAPALWFARLFAAWPRGEDASFEGLLAKGGCAWGAAWSAAAGSVAPVVAAMPAYPPFPGATGGSCAVAHPWPGEDAARVAVACGGAPVGATWARLPAAGGGEELVLSFDAPLGALCEVTLA